MKNPASYLRKAIYTALNGQVEYDGDEVPVYENEGDSSSPYQILIMEYSDSDRSTKHNFGSNATQVIEVVAKQNDSTRKAVDEIGESVMDIIKPTTRTSGVANSSDFQNMIWGRPSLNHLTEDAASGEKIVRLIMRYNLLINEN